MSVMCLDTFVLANVSVSEKTSRLQHCWWQKMHSNILKRPAIMDDRVDLAESGYECSSGEWRIGSYITVVAIQNGELIYVGDLTGIWLSFVAYLANCTAVATTAE